jgi:hypothetical protein
LLVVLAFGALLAVASCGSKDRPPPAGDPTAADANPGIKGDAASDADAGATTQCTNGIDDDGDGLIDALDPECTGPFDNDEATFGSGITSDNSDPCKQDCLFDGNSGQGDDGCEWDLGCDPLKPAGDACQLGGGGSDAGNTADAADDGGDGGGAPADAGPTSPPLACTTPQTQQCRDSCADRTPNGCDCFGCCSFPLGGGEVHVRLTATCNSKLLGDPSKCARCTPVPSCQNTCETCEICTGKTQLPASCTTGPTCPDKIPVCGADGSCPLGTYCVTGCCVVVVR